LPIWAIAAVLSAGVSSHVKNPKKIPRNRNHFERYMGDATLEERNTSVVQVYSAA
jgi:hypothetical protein